MEIKLTDQELNLPVSKLSDQVLNEWVCYNVMRWNPIHKCGDSIYNATLLPRLEIFDPCQDLNHTRLMEDKIREMGKDEDFSSNLGKVMDIHFYDCEHFVGVASEDAFNFSHASARQRCEAAYLTFQGFK